MNKVFVMVGTNWNHTPFYANSAAALQARLHLEIWRELSEDADHVASRGKKST